jgi:glycosyltransferase involved in cell wall biosynthesis
MNSTIKPEYTLRVGGGYNKIKLLHVYKDFNVYNGLIEILMILAQNFDHDKYELGVCVFRYDGNSFGDKFEKLRGKIFNLGISKTLYNEPREIAALYRFFKKYQPDIVQTHVLKSNLYGTIAAKLARVPVIIGTEMTLKDTAPSSLRRLRDKLLHPVVGSMIGRCDTFMVTSEFIKKEWYHQKYDRKYKVIYPPFNLEKYDAAMKSSLPDEKHKGPTIGFVGRLSEEKGIHWLLKAMVKIKQEIPDVHLLIVGTGPIEKELKDLCSSLLLNSHVVFAGYKPNAFELLRQLDVFIIPSRSEGCPIVVLEAMAMGLPVVASHVGGNPELVRDGETGYLVPYNRIDELASAVVAILKNKDKADEMGNAGKKLAFSKFHPSQFVRQLQEMYLQLYREKVPTHT